MSFRQIDIKHSYVSYGDENIAKAFLIPMFRLLLHSLSLLLYFWHSKSGKDALHGFLLIRLQSVHQFPQQLLLLTVKITTAYIPSVRDTDTG